MRARVYFVPLVPPPYTLVHLDQCFPNCGSHIKIGSNSYEKVKTFKYLGSLLKNQNSIQEEIKCILKAGNSCYYSVQNTFVF